LQLQVSVAPDANQDRPIPVDLVFVWDKKTAGKLEALTAKDWFDKKAQFRQEDPAERSLAIREWEWVPGQAVPEIDMSVRAAARRWLQAIFVFANYRTEGPHRFRLAAGSANLTLLREDASVLKTDVAEKAPLTDKRN
jgi:type VI secretion system protein